MSEICLPFKAQNDPIQIIQRPIRKRAIKIKQHSRKLIDKRLQILIRVPPHLNMKQYFRTKFDIQFSLDTYNDNLLGDLGVNIFSVGYHINQISREGDKIRFEFSGRDMVYTDFEIIFAILDKIGMIKARQNIEKLIQKYSNIEQNQLVTLQDISDVYSYAQNYPYECYLGKLSTEGNTILQYNINKKYLNLMAINEEMLINYYQENQLLPCAIKVDSYLDVWNVVFGAYSTGQENYNVELQNFNGRRSYVDIEQKQLFFMLDGQLHFILFWIYRTQVEDREANQNYQQILEQFNPKPKQATYRDIIQQQN
ncbi:hypothetical protein pb186bvf_014595 [Paramecium bursaria]